jgi:ubiquinol-cytochrome c reductase cytochrome b subunit
MMGTAFMGYVLPWGQMSFWGVTVITNLASAIPFVGKSIVEWLWGGFSVENPTLNRFFTLHYLFPFLLAGVVILHLALLHKDGSNNPLGVESTVDKVPFYPYFYVKDLLSFLGFLVFFSVFVFFYPNLLGHPVNYVPADSLSTPAHIVPEWYFLPFYAILRSIPNKVGGVVAMVGAILILMVLPWINMSEVRSSNFRGIYKTLFWIFFFNFCFLGWLGQKSVEVWIIVLAGQLSTFFYFFFFVLFPFIGLLEAQLRRYPLSS